MSATMDWVGNAGAAPQLYEAYLVPAFFGPFAEGLVDAVGLTPGMSVLDVACGTGAVSRAAARRVGSAGMVIGVDLSPGMLAEAAGQPPEPAAARIEYLEASAEELPVPPGRFDVVLCRQGLQFFADRGAALRAMSSAVAPGGRIALATWTDPAQATGFAALADALEMYVGQDAGDRMRQPWAISDPGELARLLTDAGMGRVEVTQHTRTARFAPRTGFARNLVLATPLASAFADATDPQQQLILEHVTAAVDGCDGGRDELHFPMTTNVAVARDPHGERAFTSSR